MLRVMLQKLWHKKWMVMCLLLGCLLLISTVVSFPMYRTAAFDRMLQDEFEAYLTESGRWPAMNQLVLISKKDRGGSTISKVEELMAGIYDEMGVREKETICYYSLAKADAYSLMNRSDVQAISLRLSAMTGLPDHAGMLAGEMYSEDGRDEEGNIEVVISQACMVDAGLLVGEVIEFDALKGPDGGKLRLKITGVYEEAAVGDFYWQNTPEEMKAVCFMEEQLFHDLFTGENAGRYTITCSYYALFEYADLKAADVEHIREYTDYLTQESPYRSTMGEPAYREILADFAKKQSRIEATLFILQVPVLILLGAFLFMISGQMYDMERNEISVIKSRGSSSGQIFRLYLYQSVFLTLLGAIGGIPLGTLFCRILGSARNFLEFTAQGQLEITWTWEVLYYSLAAMGACILIMTVPAGKHSRLTIVKLKQQKALKKHSWWEKCFLDLICLGVSLYGYYSFSRNQSALVENVLMGEALDPLLYISSSLFIVGMGLLVLRLQPLLVRGIYTLGRRFWRPASYASFMENMKNGRKQQFIMLFMILTVSLGMFHATVARTILQNARENMEYLDGADIIIREVWNTNASASGESSGELTYYEPDYSKYASLDMAKSYTRVIRDENAYLADQNYDRQRITLLGIHTREFGENTWLDQELLGRHYYELLNELAVEPGGVLVSRNFQTLRGYKVGDTIRYYNSAKKEVRSKIVDFVDYWPGYEPATVSLNADGGVSTQDNYLVIAHYSTLQKTLGTVPYEVWITLKEGADTEELYAWVQEHNVHIVKYVDKKADQEKVITDPLMQGTNGVLTMGFIVTLILCAVGYLIYWIMSIRSREMMFGVLRASGMHKGEIFYMLINEQIFSGLFAIIAGVGIGHLSSRMFVPMLQTAYAASNQVLPMKLITRQSDMLRLYGVVAGVMALCLAVLIFIVFRMNVAKALKLGEE